LRKVSRKHREQCQIDLGAAQRARKDQRNQCHAALLDHLAETSQPKGALVTIDAINCQIAIADKVRYPTLLY
jgi:hypothetical protein